ncbi:MAG: saccharopine dehydrogenase NADP-binding domain-containing protein [Crocinitomicaceae bacterium]|nr:saccharopine dehydrogenase NADP-binding domain-containing protein [Crocinitomicaceae bacterium]
MKKILIIGAGRSSSDLIRYLLGKAPNSGWKIRIGDKDPSFAAQKLASSPHGEAFFFDVSDEEQRRSEIADADIVISMVPASMHLVVANDCIHFAKNAITPSYVSDEMLELDQKAREKGVLILNEMGVDPGIDHMSAMKIIDSIRSNGGDIQSFESFTGGLIAPESDNNPWNYKITWNPRNVVLAGYGGTARFIRENEAMYIPYQRLFERITEVDVAPLGKFEGYANRDSLKYRKTYGLDNIPTLFRGTLRRPGFCKAWNVLVQTGLTDDSFLLESPSSITWRELTASFVNCSSKDNVEMKLRRMFTIDEDTINRLKWLGIFDDKPVNIEEGTPAMALQQLIEEKWKLGENDNDMLVMWHRFNYYLNGKQHEIQSSLTVLGENRTYTAMSKTVGLPIAIAAGMILEGKITLKGICLPVHPEIYLPVLSGLEQHGVSFVEHHTVVS